MFRRIFDGKRVRGTRRVSSAHPRIRKQFYLRLIKLVILIGIIGLVGGLVFVGVRSVLELKTGSNTEGLVIIESSGDVVGIPGVPSYPGSVFLYQDYIEEVVVQRFLSSGKSAYQLPERCEWNDVVLYYREALLSRGWEHVLSVAIEDDSRLHGEYWVFGSGNMGNEQPVSDTQQHDASELPGDLIDSNDDAIAEEAQLDGVSQYGLRIYPKINAVWYERISVEQARTGLSERVARDKEIELLLSMQSMKDLPDSFPWKLSYPESWNIAVRQSLVMQADLVEFSMVGSDRIVTIEPIAYRTGEDLADIAERFLEEVNSRRGEKDRLVIIDSVPITIGGQHGLKCTLFGGEHEGFFVVTVHPWNGLLYAVTSFSGEEAFFNYIVEHLTP